MTTQPQEEWEKSDEIIDRFLAQPYFNREWEGVYNRLRLEIKTFIRSTREDAVRETENRLNNCACKEKWTFGVVHCKDMPCYWPPRLAPMGDVNDPKDLTKEG